MPPPVVLLALGGTADIPATQDELRSVKDRLQPFDAAGDLSLRLEAIPDAGHAASILGQYAGRIELLHYAGHATGSALELDGQRLLAEGLVAYFTGKKPPQVVFLNGCSSMGQVDAWLSVGARAVIATATPIGDETARTFAEAFYDQLAERGTVRAAYAEARRRVNLTRATPLPEAETRLRTHFLAPGETTAPVAEAAAPWGLYLHPESGANGANYRLPWYRGRILTKVEAVNFKQNQATDNFFLLEVLQSLADYDVSLPDKVLAADQYESGLFQLLSESFPWTVSASLSPLYHVRSPRERLELLTATFYALGKTLYFVALSEWWWLTEHGHLGEPITVPSLADTEGNERYPYLDYWGRLIRLQRQLDALPDANRLPRFVPELGELTRGSLSNDEDCRRALAFFAKLCTAEDLNTAATDPIAIEDGEFYLATLLHASAFLAGFELLAVRDIGVDYRRGREASFHHVLGKLHGHEVERLDLKRDAEGRATYFYSNAVVMTRRERSENDGYLCLSPLIIDLNTYHAAEEGRQRLLRVFTFSYREDERYYWHEAGYHPLTTTSLTGRVVHSQMSRAEFESGRSPQEGESGSRLAARSRQRSGVMLPGVTELMEELQKDLTPHA